MLGRSPLPHRLAFMLLALVAAPDASAFEGFHAMHIRPPVVDASLRGVWVKRIDVDVELAFDRRWRPPDGDLPPWTQGLDRPARLVATTRMTIDLVVNDKRRQALRLRVPYTAAGTAADGLGPAHPDRVEGLLSGVPIRVQHADESVVWTDGPSRHVSVGQWTDKGKTALSYTFVFTHGVATRAIFSWKHGDPLKGFQRIVDDKTQIAIHVHSKEPWIADSKVKLEVISQTGVVNTPGALPFARVDTAIAKQLKRARRKGHRVAVVVVAPGRDEPGFAERRAAEVRCHQRPEHHYVWRNGLCLQASSSGAPP